MCAMHVRMPLNKKQERYKGIGEMGHKQLLLMVQLDCVDDSLMAVVKRLRSIRQLTSHVSPSILILDYLA
jgi:phosphoribosyl-AMP cyclohydrolase